MTPKTSKFMSVTLLGLALMAGEAHAENAPSDEVRSELDRNPGAHIDMAGRLRMLSQLVPANACQATGGFGTDYALSEMNAATAEFDAVINALEFGDPELGINYPEERRLTLAAIADVRAAWTPLNDFANAVSEQSDTDADLTNALTTTHAIVEATNALAVQVVGQYSNPAEMAQAEVFLIDMAGRQRMLIQSISKNACLTMTAHSNETIKTDLVENIGVFAATLDALENGMPAMGIRKPPTPEIAEELAQVRGNWNAIQPFLSDVVADTSIDADFAATQFRVINELSGQMERVVELYSSL